MWKRIVLLACVLLCLSGPLLAQTPIRPYEEYSKRLRDQEQVAPLKSDLFGDSVSLYNGSTEFVVTDIDIPGNNQLPVRLQRRFRVESKKESETFGGFGAWDIEVPHMAGTFDAVFKWNIGANSTLVNRCSQLWHPKAVAPIEVRDIWSGTHIQWLWRHL